MLKASALYLVIVIALVIGVLCSSLIAAAYFYRSEYQKKFRYDQLQNNLHSGINILLTCGDTAYRNQVAFNLFNNNEIDSVSLQKVPWGIYDIGIARAFIQKDTLFKIFSIANTVDSSKWGALHLRDEDRPFSVSGKTMIRGDAYLPKAGIQKAYIDNKAYEGDKRLVIGKKNTSGKKLPALDTIKLKSLYDHLNIAGNKLPIADSLSQSFLQPTKVFDFKKEARVLRQVKLKGNIILRSDTTLTIDSTAKLDNVLVFARAIIVKEGFSGNCQLFATDSISVGPNCHFNYPSCLGILRFEPPTINSQAKIVIGESSFVNGLIFTYERKPNDLKPLITIDKKALVKGQVYSQDALELKDGAELDGCVFTSRFLYRSAFTLYENYLINASIDEKALSPYYLTSGITPVATKKKKILQWLEGN